MHAPSIDVLRLAGDGSPARLARRRFLVRAGTAAAGLLVLPACRGGAQPTVTAAIASPTATPQPTVVASGATETASPTATPTPSATPTATATAVAPPTATPEQATATATPASGIRVEVDPPAVGQGETMLVRVRGVASGTLIVRGLVHDLVPGVGEAWAVIGIPIDARLGAAPIVARPRSATGAALAEVSGSYTVTTVERPVDYLTLTPEQGAVLTPEAGRREIQLRAQQFSTFDTTPRWDGVIARPITAAYYVSTAYGQARSYNGGPLEGFHTGEDLAADEGTPVYASAPGRVIFAAPMPIRGNSVVVDHGGGVMTGYHHLSAMSVESGQMVAAGAPIGNVGATGLATGPHLHWELTIYGVNVDPETWVKRSFAP